MIKSTALEFTHGLTVAAMKATGTKENSMVLARTLFLKTAKLSMDSGKTERGLNGLIKFK
jgi:hypothetical protein